MKTLDEYILEVKQEMVHKCSEHCSPSGSFPKHMGGGHYDSLEHIPATLDVQIYREAAKRYNKDLPKMGSSSSSSNL